MTDPTHLDHARLSPTPSRMDLPSWGLFRGALDAGPEPPSLRLPALRRKRWIYLGVYSQGEVLGVAVVNLGFASNAFAYLGPLDGARATAWKRKGLPWSASVDRHRARWVSGRDDLELLLPRGTLAGSLRGDLHTDQGLASFDLMLTSTGGRSPSAVTCVAPSGEGPLHRWNLTVKDNTLHATGTVRWGDRTLTLDAPAIADVTDAFPARRTVWHWASLAGRDTEGRAVGVNLCALHNDSDRARENVLWLDGEPLALGPVRFSFRPDARASAPWTISGEGVELRFDPVGMREGDENLVVVVSRFVQPYGRFHGTLTAGGRTVKLEGVPGVVEDHQAVW